MRNHDALARDWFRDVAKTRSNVTRDCWSVGSSSVQQHNTAIKLLAEASSVGEMAQRRSPSVSQTNRQRDGRARGNICSH